MPDESLLTKQALVRQRSAFCHFLYYTDFILILLLLSPWAINNPISAVLPLSDILLMVCGSTLLSHSSVVFSRVWDEIMQLSWIRAQPWVSTAESQHGKMKRLGHFRWLETSLAVGFINWLKIRLDRCADSKVFLKWVFQIKHHQCIWTMQNM